MKKTLSIILTLCMVLGLCSFSVAAAPEGTAITDAAGFAAMEPTGTYYLANDIAINEPYAQAFTGTLDGNGKTVTVTQPMFADFGGKIKNLTVEGTITALAADAEIAIFAAQGARGAVAAAVACGTEVVFENIKNNATVAAIGNIPDSDDCAGGIVGTINNAEVKVSFINCENNAAITGLNQIGGIAGYAKAAASVAFEGCVNNGVIAETDTTTYCGGILCRSDAEFVSFKNCVNNAKVSSGKDQAGGMFAYASKGSYVFDGCVNNGEIAPTVGKAAGLIGNINCNDADGKTGYYVTVTNCANYAAVTAGGANYAAGIAACIQKNLKTTIANCVNYGEIKGGHDSGGIMGHTTQAAMKISFCENFGTVNTAGAGQYAGGICGYAWGTKTASWTVNDYANVIEYCINHADIVAGTRAGGICGSTGTSNSRGISLIQYCINLGDVTSKGEKDSFSQNCAGGILGYGYGTTETAHPKIENCITVGNVTAENATAAGNAAYFLGYVNSPLAIVEGNTAIGTLTSPSGNITAIGRNEGQDFASVANNSIPAGTGYALTYENTVTDKVYEVGTSDEAALTSGKTVYELNQAAKAAGATADLVYMTVDGTFVPTLIAAEDGSNSIVKNADGTFGNPVKEPETTEPAPETTEPPVGPSTGDSFVIFAVIAVVSVLGIALVSKRREN